MILNHTSANNLINDQSKTHYINNKSCYILYMRKTYGFT